MFKSIKIRPMFAWYDIWVGLFVDKNKKTLYLFPIPMLGLKIQYGKISTSEYLHVQFDPNGPVINKIEILD